jgi:hypothetical protein
MNLRMITWTRRRINMKSKAKKTINKHLACTTWYSVDEKPIKDRALAVISKFKNGYGECLNTFALEMVTDKDPTPITLDKEHLICWAYIILPNDTILGSHAFNKLTATSIFDNEEDQHATKSKTQKDR